MHSLAFVAAAVLCGGCFYFDPINAAPTATIQVPAGPFHLKDPATFQATGFDPDGDALEFQWICQGCDPNFGTDAVFQTTIAAHGSIQVRLIVTDTHGAVDNPVASIEVANRAPSLDVVIDTPSRPDGSFTLSQPIVLAAQGVDPDGDPVAFSGVFHAPPASNPNLARFVSTAAASWTLTPDVPGQWSIDFTSADRFGGMTQKTVPLTVGPDGPPCIAVTVPDASSDGHYLVLGSDGPRRFVVDSVTDDLDPYPGSGEQFSWSLGVDGAALTSVAGHDLADFTIDPADYVPGDVLALRVEVADRVARTLPCGPDQPRCSIGGDACFQRETWEVEIR